MAQRGSRMHARTSPELGSTTALLEAGSSNGAAAGSPPAVRSGRTRWRDPRLVVGIAIVALSALLGARLLGGADDTVGVWVARDALNEGQPVGAGDLEPRQIRFDDQADADRYLSADDAVPSGSALDRPVGAGELVPRSALRGTGPGSLTEVPLSVDTENVPDTVRVGATVDVWVTPDGARGAGRTGTAARSTLVFDDVAVVSVPEQSTTLGPTSTRQVIVGVDDEHRSDLPTAIASLAGGDVLVTLQR